MTPCRIVCLLFLLLAVAAVAPVAATTGDAWVFAYRPGCGDCDKALPIVEAYHAAHPEQPIEFLALNASPEAVLRYNNLSDQSGVQTHIPVIFTRDGVIMTSGRIRDFLENVSDVSATPTPAQQNATPLAPLTPLAVASAGLVDGINPCAFAVLALLLGALTVAGTQRRVLTIGGAYTLGVFACYLAAGFGITAVVGAAGVAPLFRLAAGAVSLIVGLTVLAAAVLQRRSLAPAISSGGRRAISGWVRKASAAGPVAALAIGIGVGLVELPCTGGIYLGVLGLLAGGALADAVPLLVLYNLFFVLPLVLIVGAVAFGLTPSAVDEWRETRRRTVLGISGLMMVVLGLALLAAELA